MIKVSWLGRHDQAIFTDYKNSSLFALGLFPCREKILNEEESWLLIRNYLGEHLLDAEPKNATIIASELRRA